jgi:hypothetical protein
VSEDATHTDKAARRQARQSADAAEAAFAAGDYALTLRLCLNTVQLGPDTEIGLKALQRASFLRTDPHAVYAGLCSFALYGAAWIYALTR